MLHLLVAKGDRSALAEALNSLGYTTVGQRKRAELALADGIGDSMPASSSNSTASVHQYHVDMFGTKRGGRLQACGDAAAASCDGAGCHRYRPTLVPVNHCSMGANLAAITCTRCDLDCNKHADLGSWVEGEPMLVDAAGRRYRHVDAAVLVEADAAGNAHVL